ncbi:dephospho-CoA kinase [Brachybacterium sp. EF45031]|uniref:dephospho-CoA kinase n=1 Tax=Brachybacterium sillae TaxID=2810536 RepID=UPI00217D77B9|nr:dephospho-CoA kinase [Brachybacterium sillae]MCS6710590.1 dephospho-CoA kinase [Brachybacterium sillae]
MTQQVWRIGLTGGIASGKSTVAALWRAEGLTVIDLDAHSRRVLDEPGEAVDETVARFGEAILRADGSIDRGALARIVFADADARADLERIVLRRVDEAVRQEEQRLRESGVEWWAHDSPLLLEKHQDDRYDVIVVVTAPREERIRRIMEDRGKDREYAESVMAAQVDDAERERRADVLLRNDGDRATLEARAREVLARLSVGRRRL